MGPELGSRMRSGGAARLSGMAGQPHPTPSHSARRAPVPTTAQPPRRRPPDSTERKAPSRRARGGRWGRIWYIQDVTEEERSAIIALCEDPDEDFSDVRGRAPTSEDVAMVASIADAMFSAFLQRARLMTSFTYPHMFQRDC